MTELLRQASDDQLALALCFGAVAISAVIMYFSQHVGSLAAQMRASELERSKRLPLKLPVSVQEPAARKFPNERAA